MHIIIPFILAAVFLLVVIGIIIKKFEHLVILDVGGIPEIKQNKKKDQFIRKKAEESAKNVSGTMLKFLSPFFQVLKRIQLAFRKYVGKIERRTVRERNNLIEEEGAGLPSSGIQAILYEAQHEKEIGDFDNAEKKFIAIIKQDSKNREAYQGLADVYYKQGHIDEAKETYLFVLQLEPNNEESLVKLAEIAEEQKNREKAVEYYQQTVLINPHNPSRFYKLFDLLFHLEQFETALEAIRQALVLEPQNPKYLDNFIEVSILLGRKDLAEDGYSQLRVVNQDNKKLISFRQRIDEMN